MTGGRDTTAPLVDALRAAYRAAADPERAAPMARYMRDQFEFHGIRAPDRRRIDREVLAGRPAPTEPELAEVVRACWRLPQREYQYFACDHFARNVGRCTLTALPVAEELITTKSWWDTVDALAANVVGRLVQGDPDGLREMDRLIEDDDIWLVRTALLHQLRYGDETDGDRLFRYCRRRATDTEFFVRKAIGWALRQYAKTAPDAVREFVAATELSNLSRREALKGVTA